MDINKELNDIIFKYHLDRCYPHYRNMLKAEKIVRNIVREIVNHHKKAVFLSDDKMGIAFIRNIVGDYDDIHFLFYKRYDTDLHQLEKLDWNEYDEVYIISLYGEEYVERWFRLRQIQYVWIYDVFEQENLFLQKEFFTFARENMLTLIDSKKEQILSSAYTGGLQCELYCQQSKYKNANDWRTKQIALEKCLFLALYMKNFVAAEEYATLLAKDNEIYERIWNEIHNLLDMIRKSVSHRKQDIVLYWLDAIPYGGESDMPYLHSVMEKSVVFENAFTNIGYTSPTLRAMFLGKRDIDDRGYCISDITEENSPLVRFLQEKGYNIKIFSGHFGFQFREQPVQNTVDWLVPASMKYWDMISEMLLQEQKIFWIAHTLDAHAPYLSWHLNDDNYTNKNERYRLAKRQLDEQLSFYDQMISNEVVRIYMSDHGKEAIYKYHALFSIYHKLLSPRKVEGLFSYLDFGIVLKQLIMNRSIDEKEFEREYVEIGNMDCFNYDNIAKIFRNKGALMISFFGQKGIIDKEYIYIHYATGKEWLHKRKEKFLCEPLLYYDCEEDVCEPELLPKYRKLTGEYPKELIEDEKFKYARYLYALYHNTLEHNNLPERIRIINRLLSDYPDNSVGIRTGGGSSAKIYYALSKESKKKIWGFIDNDEECLCSRLQLPVVKCDQVAKLESFGVKAVLLSSYTYIRMLREESKAWPSGIDILDIYDCFDKNGIECREEFYKIIGSDEDYEVGFPFDV